MIKRAINFLLTFIAVAVSSVGSDMLAQSPHSINYQAVIIDSASTTVKNQIIGMRVSILENSPTGNAIYTERHTPKTDAHGLISFEIGKGTVENGNFSLINWAAKSHFIKTETDLNGGTDYKISGVSQLLSVPYAYYAEKSGSNIQGPTGPPGNPGPKGADGQSAYEIWLSLGNTGSEADFLKALTGPPGDPGSGTSFSHKLGDEFGGGIIFHLWRDLDGTEHGLIVSKTELYLNASDPLEGIEWSNVHNSEIGAAAQSTWDGKANTNAIVAQPGHNHGAAKLCNDYVSGGFNDWYLPSLTELRYLWLNRFSVNKTISDINDASRISLIDSYWSSTEYNAGKAYYIFFSTGEQSIIQNKDAGFKVRGIRRY